jgi:hypothetical protein
LEERRGETDFEEASCIRRASMVKNSSVEDENVGRS